MNAIFFDIDNTLNGNIKPGEPFKQDETGKRVKYKNIDDEALEYLRRLQNKYQAKMILISSWRYGIKDLEELKKRPITTEEEYLKSKSYCTVKTFYEKIKKEYNLEIDDITCNFSNLIKFYDKFERILEVQWYLMNHPEIKKFVILDDESYDGRFEKHLITCFKKQKSFGKYEYEEACKSFETQVNYVPEIENIKDLHNCLKKEKLKEESESER